MSIHPFKELQGEYTTLLQGMKITRTQAVETACNVILRPSNLDRYKTVAAKTGVPAVFIGALDFREDDCNPHDGLGQGDPWNSKSVNVPRGCGPFNSWEEAAEFYIHFDHLDDNSVPYDVVYACWKGEIWNGFGYRNHNVHSSYLWGGTNIQQAGKFVRDGKFDATVTDTQVGIIPIITRCIERVPALAFGAPVIRMVPPAQVPLVPVQIPIFSLKQTKWVQDSLNTLGEVPWLLAPLDVDGNYGRNTRESVRVFQETYGIPANGLADSVTIAALQEHLKQEQ